MFNNEQYTNVATIQFPVMLPIQAISDKSGIPYKTIWQWCKENKIVHRKTGNKYLINVDKFIEFLNTSEQ